MFAPTFRRLLAQGAAACPQCVWNEVLAGLIEEDARPIALLALVINPLPKFCSFAGPLQLSRVAEAVHTKSCVAFSFMATLFQANVCTCRGFSAIELVLEGMGCGKSMRGLRLLKERRVGM